MIRLSALSLGCLLAAQAIAADKAVRLEYPTVGIVYNTTEDHGLRYDCTLLDGGELGCEFIQTSVRPALSDKEAASLFLRVKEDLKPERFEETQRETCKGYREYSDYIRGVKPAPDPKALAKQLSYRASREAAETWLALAEKFCKFPTHENYEALGRFNIQTEQRTCRISVNPFRQTFKPAPSDPTGGVWVVDSKPVGACGVVQLTRFERVNSGSLKAWTYVARKAVTNPKGTMEMPTGQLSCSNLDESEYFYDWKQREIGLGCDFIEFSAL